jgi:chromosomal replication initiation ATPase DnaA
LSDRSLTFAAGLTVAELPEVLAAYNGSGYVVAPAGFGKTHLIAAALHYAEKRQLVLTHTYAGVNALRRKLRQERVTDGACLTCPVSSDQRLLENGGLRALS